MSIDKLNKLMYNLVKLTRATLLEGVIPMDDFNFDYRTANLYQLSLFWVCLLAMTGITRNVEKQRIAQDYVADLVDEGIYMAQDIIREAVTAMDWTD